MMTRLLAIAVLFFLPSLLIADQISIEVTTTGSGALGDANFTDELVTIRGVGDTDNVVVDGSANLLLEDFQVFVEIDGFATANFTDAIQAVSNNVSDLGGFGNSTNSMGLLFVNDAAFADYDLLTDIGPVTGIAIFSIGVPHQTEIGNFRLFSTTGDATFNATVVPEPAAAILIGVGTSFVCLRRQRIPTS